MSRLNPFLSHFLSLSKICIFLSVRFSFLEKREGEYSARVPEMRVARNCIKFTVDMFIFDISILSLTRHLYSLEISLESVKTPFCYLLHFPWTPNPLYIVIPLSLLPLQRMSVQVCQMYWVVRTKSHRHRLECDSFERIWKQWTWFLCAADESDQASFSYVRDRVSALNRC